MLVQFGLPYTDMSKGALPFTWIVESIGYLGFYLYDPDYGAYIARRLPINPLLPSISGVLSGER